MKTIAILAPQIPAESWQDTIAFCVMAMCFTAVCIAVIRRS